METIKTVKEMQEISDKLKSSGKTIAFVPTMGFFHEGHLNLMKRGSELADVVVASLYVNPTQFAPNEDFERYPRSIQRDSKLAEDAGVDYLFLPETSEMYPGGFGTSIKIGDVTKKFEGVTRPDHFQGVATVVAKLFNAVKPHIAIFGQKDYQQTLVVKKLVTDLLFDISIVIAPTTREEDGLAKSSRNIYLSDEDRLNATILYRSLEAAREAILKGENRRKVINAIMHNSLRSVTSIKLDYASSAIADNLDEPEVFLPGQLVVLLIAVYLGKTRLIDNALVTIPSPSETSRKFIEGM